MSLLIWLLVLSLLLNVGLFLVAYRLQSDKLTDASYAVTFVALGLAAYIVSPQSPYHFLLLGMVCVWAVRIGGFLLYRVIRRGKDGRFDGIRENFLQFGKFWVAQGLSVWILMIASVLAMQHDSELSWPVWLGVAVWAVGLVIEAVADTQKYLFTSNPNNRGKWIDEGVWHYSRHPNYFGEILVWLGVYIVAAQSLDAMQALLVVVSPLFITILLLFVSGVPILEKSADKKWGHSPAYRRYKRQTSIIVPLPRRD